MASTIENGTLTVTITELLTMDDPLDNDHGISATNVLSLPNIDEVVKRIVEIPVTETGLLAFAGTVDEQVAADSAGARQDTYVAGHFNQNTVRYIRITNQDDTNHVTLVVRGESGAEFAVMLDGFNSFIYSCDTIDGAGVVLTTDAHDEAQTHSLGTLRDITAKADTGPVDLEIFVAST
jgi:hypothetical protein